MIQINLSEKQARELMIMMMWGADEENETACEIITQIENQLMPRAIEQAELAAWRGNKRVKEG